MVCCPLLANGNVFAAFESGAQTTEASHPGSLRRCQLMRASCAGVLDALDGKDLTLFAAANCDGLPRDVRAARSGRHARRSHDRLVLFGLTIADRRRQGEDLRRAQAARVSLSKAVLQSENGPEDLPNEIESYVVVTNGSGDVISGPCVSG